MTTHTARKIFSIVIFAAGILAGCEGSPPPFQSINDQFKADDEPRAMDGLYKEQTAIAARQDGTLYPQHFTDGQLNSLGYSKLAAMTYGPEAGKLAIYLDIPNDTTYASCESSVTTYLTQRGLASNGYMVTAGPNPNVGSPAALGLAGLAKQEKTSGDVTSSDASNSTAETH